ncbi:MAG: thioredoxin family protein [Candidatus Nanopelagicales bacterium]|nr:thioredoxin family protein [Candidatus Nanopelagicales bacterium]
MAVKESNMTPLGTPLPDLTIPDLDGNPVSLRVAATARPSVIAFLCNHCPYVRHVEPGITAVAAEFAPSDVVFLGVCSNDIERYPDDDVPGLREQQARTSWRFPYLIDADQSAAKAFGAACTPDFFVYSAAGKLVYRGALDNATPGNHEPVTGDLLRDAIGKTLAGETVPQPHRPSLGCGIKWKPGNEPEAVTND